MVHYFGTQRRRVFSSQFLDLKFFLATRKLFWYFYSILCLLEIKINHLNDVYIGFQSFKFIDWKHLTGWSETCAPGIQDHQILLLSSFIHQHHHRKYINSLLEMNSSVYRDCHIYDSMTLFECLKKK